MESEAPKPEMKRPMLWPVILWTAAILAALGLAWFVGAVVVPYFQARAAVHERDVSRLGPPRQAVRKLVVYLKVSRIFPGERKHRGMAVQLLGEVGKEETVPVLVEALKDTDAKVRLEAALALRGIGPRAREAIFPLIEALKDTDVEVRFWAASALGSIGHEVREAIPALIAALKDSHWSVRSEAAWALGEIGPEAREAIPALEATLNDKYGVVRAEAKDALDKIRAAPAKESGQ